MKIKDFLHYSYVPAGTTGERTIFGEPNKKLEYVYDDRLRQWDYKQHEKAKQQAGENDHTSEWYEKYLSIYYDRKIKLQHILIGVNVSTGYQYLVFGF